MAASALPEQNSRLVVNKVLALQRFLCASGASTLYGSEVYPDAAAPELITTYDLYSGKVWLAMGAPQGGRDYCGMMPAEWACGLYNNWAEKDAVAPCINSSEDFVSAFDAAFNQHGIIAGHHEHYGHDELDDGMVWVFLPPPMAARVFFKHFASSSERNVREAGILARATGIGAPHRQGAPATTVTAPVAARVGTCQVPVPSTPPKKRGERFVDAPSSSDEAAAAGGEPDQKREHLRHQEEEPAREIDELFQPDFGFDSNSGGEEEEEEEEDVYIPDPCGRAMQMCKSEGERDKQRILAVVAAAPSESEPEDDESEYGASELSDDSDSDVSKEGRSMVPLERDISRAIKAEKFEQSLKKKAEARSRNVHQEDISHESNDGDGDEDDDYASEI